MATKTDVNKNAMIQALEKCMGNVTEACKAVGMARTTHYDWMEKDPDYRAAVESVADIALDYVESKLMELIDGPEKDIMTEAGPVRIKDSPTPSAVIFYLKTKGQRRGYVERQEITGANEGPVQIVIPPNI